MRSRIQLTLDGQDWWVESVRSGKIEMTADRDKAPLFSTHDVKDVIQALGDMGASRCELTRAAPHEMLKEAARFFLSGSLIEAERVLADFKTWRRYSTNQDCVKMDECLMYLNVCGDIYRGVYGKVEGGNVRRLKDLLNKADALLEE